MLHIICNILNIKYIVVLYTEMASGNENLVLHSLLISLNIKRDSFLSSW